MSTKVWVLFGAVTVPNPCQGSSQGGSWFNQATSALGLHNFGGDRPAVPGDASSAEQGKRHAAPYPQEAGPRRANPYNKPPDDQPSSILQPRGASAFYSDTGNSIPQPAATPLASGTSPRGTVSPSPRGTVSPSLQAKWPNATFSRSPTSGFGTTSATGPGFGTNPNNIAIPTSNATNPQVQAQPLQAQAAQAQALQAQAAQAQNFNNLINGPNPYPFLKGVPESLESEFESNPKTKETLQKLADSLTSKEDAELRYKAMENSQLFKHASNTWQTVLTFEQQLRADIVPLEAMEHTMTKYTGVTWHSFKKSAKRVSKTIAQKFKEWMNFNAGSGGSKTAGGKTAGGKTTWSWSQQMKHLFTTIASEFKDINQTLANLYDENSGQRMPAAKKLIAIKLLVNEIEANRNRVKALTALLNAETNAAIKATGAQKSLLDELHDIEDEVSSRLHKVARAVKEKAKHTWDKVSEKWRKTFSGAAGPTPGFDQAQQPASNAIPNLTASAPPAPVEDLNASSNPPNLTASAPAEVQDYVNESQNAIPKASSTVLNFNQQNARTREPIIDAHDLLKLVMSARCFDRRNYELTKVELTKESEEPLREGERPERWSGTPKKLLSPVELSTQSAPLVGSANYLSEIYSLLETELLQLLKAGLRALPTLVSDEMIKELIEFHNKNIRFAHCWKFAPDEKPYYGPGSNVENSDSSATTPAAAEQQPSKEEASAAQQLPKEEAAKKPNSDFDSDLFASQNATTEDKHGSVNDARKEVEQRDQKNDALMLAVAEISAMLFFKERVIATKNSSDDASEDSPTDGKVKNGQRERSSVTQRIRSFFGSQNHTANSGAVSLGPNVQILLCRQAPAIVSYVSTLAASAVTAKHIDTLMFNEMLKLGVSSEEEKREAELHLKRSYIDSTAQGSERALKVVKLLTLRLEGKAFDLEVTASSDHDHDDEVHEKPDHNTNEKPNTSKTYENDTNNTKTLVNGGVSNPIQSNLSFRERNLFAMQSVVAAKQMAKWVEPLVTRSSLYYTRAVAEANKKASSMSYYNKLSFEIFEDKEDGVWTDCSYLSKYDPVQFSFLLRRDGDKSRGPKIELADVTKSDSFKLRKRQKLRIAKDPTLLAFCNLLNLGVTSPNPGVALASTEALIKLANAPGSTMSADATRKQLTTQEKSAAGHRFYIKTARLLDSASSKISILLFLNIQRKLHMLQKEVYIVQMTKTAGQEKMQTEHDNQKLPKFISKNYDLGKLTKLWSAYLEIASKIAHNLIKSLASKGIARRKKVLKIIKKTLTSRPFDQKLLNNFPDSGLKEVPPLLYLMHTVVESRDQENQPMHTTVEIISDGENGALLTSETAWPVQQTALHQTAEQTKAMSAQALTSALKPGQVTAVEPARAHHAIDPLNRGSFDESGKRIRPERSLSNFLGEPGVSATKGTTTRAQLLSDEVFCGMLVQSSSIGHLIEPTK